MAIHQTVLYSPDRRWRITADPAGKKITVERDLVFMTAVNDLSSLERYLADQGIELADLIAD